MDMRRPMAGAWALCAAALCAGAGAGEGDNPYRKTKVGDWARFEGKTVAPDAEQRVETDTTMYRQILEKNDQTAKLAMVFIVTVQGQTQQRNLPVVEIDLAAPREDLGFMTRRLPEDAKVEKSEEDGPEIIEAAGRKWECRKTAIKADIPSREMSFSAVAWFAPDAPLSGMVRMDYAMDLVAGDQKVHNESQQILTAFGDAANPDPKAPDLELPAEE